MFKLAIENLEKAREEIFNKVNENNFFIRILREKDNFILFFKIPKSLEERIAKKNPLTDTEKLFGNQGNKAEFYKGCILSDSIEDINQRLFFSNNNSNLNINLAILRLKDASKGLIISSDKKDTPLFLEEALKEAIKNFFKNTEDFVRNLSLKVDIKKEIELKKENKEKEEIKDEDVYSFDRFMQEEAKKWGNRLVDKEK